jgi:hypothetical protein
MKLQPDLSKGTRSRTPHRTEIVDGLDVRTLIHRCCFTFEYVFGICQNRDMENLAPSLLESAAAVAALGGGQGDIDSLDDASVLAGLGLIREHEQQLQAYKLWLATAVTRRSSYELGYSGLARRNGAATPSVLIQSISGSTMAEANKLVQLGAMTIEVEDAGQRPPLELSPADDVDVAAPAIVASAAWQAPLVEAVGAGRLSLDAADAIRRGLGVLDDAITSEQLRSASETLIDCAATLPPEKLWRLARQRREGLDEQAIARGEKQRADQRYLRRFRRDGMCGGSWLIPDEEGGLEIDQALNLMLASRTGGPRFVDPDAAPAGLGPIDERTNEQLLADGFVQLMRGGLDADPNVVPGKRRVAVRIMVTAETMRDHTGHGIIEGSSNTISFPSVQRQLCESGTLGLKFGGNGQVIDLGREIRLFTSAQRDALAARDGGCRVPGCEKPPSWTEAHHIDYWARDRGKTNLADGILLCRYHHMLIHNNNWQILRRDGTYWLRPPATVDPEQRPTEMPSKNPLVAALRPAS